MPTIQRKGTQNPLTVLLELGQFPPVTLGVKTTVTSSELFISAGVPCCRGNLEIGSLREVGVKSSLPATTSTERLEILDDNHHKLSVKIIGIDHRLRTPKQRQQTVEITSAKKALNKEEGTNSKILRCPSREWPNWGRLVVYLVNKTSRRKECRVIIRAVIAAQFQEMNEISLLNVIKLVPYRQPRDYEIL
ncbi:hypothetical protein JHK85_006309 [Glycine max]|nr:hypothetical protein JHK85_006309 [Glycine max]